jgi:hypothetical protein
MGKRYVVPRKLAGMVPSRLRSSAGAPLSYVYASVRGRSEVCAESVRAISVYARCGS